jgi:hypothetical protein
MASGMAPFRVSGRSSDDAQGRSFARAGKAGEAGSTVTPPLNSHHRCQSAPGWRGVKTGYGAVNEKRPEPVAGSRPHLE